MHKRLAIITLLALLIAGCAGVLRNPDGSLDFDVNGYYSKRPRGPQIQYCPVQEGNVEKWLPCPAPKR